jgi:hypothetical protein
MQTFTPREYLMIDIANSYGLDKLDWNLRIDWFKQNEDKLMSLLDTAKTPALYYAGVKAWQNVLDGKATGYPISLDGTSSGLQILAALTCDRSAALLCNVLDSGSRENAYTGIYQAMLDKLGETGHINPDEVKQAIMTALYGSEAEPVKIFGTGALLNTFYTTMEELAPAVWNLNKAFLDMWNPTALSYDWVMPDNFNVHIKVIRTTEETVNFLNTPYKVIQKVNAPKKIGRSIGANLTHSVDGMVVREMARRCMYDPQVVSDAKSILMNHGKTVGQDPAGHLPSRQTDEVLALWQHYKESGYLSARILDSINIMNVRYLDKDVVLALIDSLPVKPFTLVSVHDCWRCLPAYGNDLRYQYNLQLQLIAKSNLLGCLVGQIVGHPVQSPKSDPSMADEILQANYALS